MPEGHTILRLAREHSHIFRGERLRIDSPQGKFASGAALLDGARLIRVQAHGKHSLHRFRQHDDAPPRHDLWLHVHLGLYGKWQRGLLPLPEIRGQVRLRMWDATTWAELRGATVSEVLDQGQVKTLLLRLGEDPLSSKLDGDTSYKRIAKSTRGVGLLLMDQKVLAGVGNVYRAEILFRHSVNPYRPGTAVSPELWREMWTDLNVLMKSGVRTGRIVTTEPADRSRRSGPVRREDAHYVYRRHGLPCRRCGNPIQMEIAAGRRLYWCPVCQPD